MYCNATPDTTPPVRTNGQPTGTLSAGTTQTTLSLTTNENATCRYATTPGVAYSAMPTTFSTTGGTAHSTLFSGLTNGGSYNIFVRCQDTASPANASPDDFTITFAVAAQAPTGLVAAYGFDEASGTTTADATGHGLTGTLTSVTRTTTGKFGGALTFNGTSSWVTVAHNAQLNLTTGMTLEAWVFPTALGANWRNVLIKERTGGEIYNLYAHTDTSGPSVYVVRSAAPAAALDATGPAALPANTWTHLAATFDNTTLRLFVNGVQVASRAVAGPLLTSTGVLRIGGNSLWGEFFAGTIDEVRIYNRALSATELQTDMTTPVGAPVSDTTPPVQTNGQPAGTLPAGTTQTTLSLTTNENATCRYATTAGVAYSAMPTTFSTTGGTTHSTVFSGLTNGGSYNVFVRCQDTASPPNANPNDFAITFTVAARRATRHRQPSRSRRRSTRRLCPE